MAAIDITGMSVAFPLAIGLALVIVVITLYSNTSRSACSIIFRSFKCTCSNYYRCGYIYISISDNKSFIVSIISGILMGFFYIKFPISGKKLKFKGYFLQGTPWLHTIGILGGVILGIDFCLNFIASNVAGLSISYGFRTRSNNNSSFWRVFISKEFAKVPKAQISLYY